MLAEKSYTSKKKYKACMLCSALIPIQELKKEGCKNCKNANSTSYSYKGLIGVLKKGGWVEKWQRIDEYGEGLYAMTVEGDPDEEDVCAIEDEGKAYFDRNESFNI